MVALVVANALVLSIMPTAVSAAPRAGFEDVVVLSGLTQPTALRFSPDGRVFVGEKSGRIKVFDSLTDPTPTVFADLRLNVHDYWDRGLLGLALDPGFPAVPYVHVLYTYDAPIGGTAPRWNDVCPTPPGPTTDGCVASARLSRLQAAGDVMTGPEQVLINDWCQQFPSHSIGDLRFGPDGALYVSGGDGASFTQVDWGQLGGGTNSPTPKNPCGDPPGGVGGSMTPPTAEGGALRSQDLRTVSPPSGGTSYAAVVAGLSPVAYWRLGETSGTVAADSAGTNTGTYSGAPALNQPGLLTNDPNRAVGFDAVNDQVTVPSSTALNRTAQLSIAGWVNADSWARNPRLLQKGLTDNQYRLLVENGSLVFDLAGVGIVTAAPPAAGTRHFIVGAYDGTTMRLYVDNVLVGSLAASGPIATSGDLLAIGNKAGSVHPNDWFDGVIDEVSIHGIGLSASQVAQLWNAGTTGGGGALDPTGLNGTILRLDPATGDALPDNPLAASTDANARRVIAYGLRNPMRFTFRPGTSELWLGDVGAGSADEIDRIIDVGGAVENFGWPCWEGPDRQPGYDAANLAICENLYAGGGATQPYFYYYHGQPVVGGEPCPTGSTSIAGMAFYTGLSYPSEYRDALFFADYSRDCIWAMMPGASGLPDPGNIRTMVSQASNPVAIEPGPGGDLYYVDFDGGRIRRLVSSGGTPNNPPTAVASASPTSGTAPLTVNFNGSGSSDPDPGDSLLYAWDLDGDGVFTDSTAQNPGWTYSAGGTFSVRLRVTDEGGLSNTSAPLAITVSPPSGGTSYAAVVAGLSPVAYWRLGETSGTVAADSAGTNTGTYSGAPALNQPGLLTNDPNRAVGFDAVNDQVTVPSSTALNRTAQLSIAGWVNADSWARNPRLLQKGLTDNQYRLLVENGSLVFDLAGVGIVTAAPPAAGTRHFIVGAYDGTTMRLYVDNVLVGSLAASGPIATSGDLLAIGNKAGSVHPNDWFDGVIDEVSIHGIGLSASQVAQLWNAGTTGGGTPNNPPTAVASASPTSGTAPLTVNFNGSGSSDPDPGDSLLYAWDLDGDGVFTDSTAQNPGWTYSAGGTFSVRLRVTDEGGLSNTSAPLAITVSPPSGGTSYAAVVAGLSPVAYWRLGETSGTVAADSAGTNTGTYSGAPALNQPGLLTNDPNRAVGFDAVNDQVTVPSSTALNRTAQLSIAGWVNADSWARNPRLLQKGLTDNQYRLLVENGSLVFDLAGVGIVTAAPPAAGTRHFIVGAYDGTTMRLYVDNVLVGSLAASGPIATSGDLLAIGNKAGSVHPNDWFDGVIDEVSIHGIGLSASQVAQLWNAGTTGAPNTAPTPTITSPSSSLTWAVGDSISFSGSATDSQDGTVATSGLEWTLLMQHCPATCHSHVIQTWDGVASGSFQAPDHDYPSHLELQLRATDSGGLTTTTSVELQPRTVELTFLTTPDGLTLGVGTGSAAAPVVRTVIVGSGVSVSAPSPQTLGGVTYDFVSWTDGLAQSHVITAPPTAATYTATFTAQPTGGGGTDESDATGGSSPSAPSEPPVSIDP